MPTFVRNDVTIPDQDAVETSRTLEQDDPTISENENHVSDLNNHQSQNPNGEIRHRTRALTNEDGLGSTELDPQPNADGLDSTEMDAQSIEDGSSGEAVQTDEDKVKKRTGVKVILFDWTISIILSLVPLLAVVFGFLYRVKCPANSFIPFMVYIFGILSFIVMCYALQQTSSRNFVCLQYQTERMKLEMWLGMLNLLWLCQVVLFIFMDASFDSSADNYCDPWFYYFTIFMNVALALGFTISSIVL